MRASHAVLVALATLGVFACDTSPVEREPDEDVAEASEELVVTGPTQVGDVTVIAPPEAAPVTGPRADWRPIPGLSGAIQSGAGANLTLTVTAEMFGANGAYVRARVDGQPLELAPLFVAPGDANDDVRSFTFVVPRAAAGQHTVEVEWKPFQDGARPQMRDRTLTMHSAHPTRGTGRLAVADTRSRGAFIVSPDRYLTVPGLVTSLTTTQPGPLAITFSGDVAVAEGRLFAQAVVDGVVRSDVLVLEAGLTTRDSHSYTFVVPGVGAGPHQVEVRARVEGGAAILLHGSVAVASAPGTSRVGGMAATGAQLAPTAFTSTDFVDVPSLTTSFRTRPGASTLLIDTGGEVLVSGGGRLFLRALLDGVPVRPGNVTFLQDTPTFRAQTFAFTLDNVPPGLHTVRIQAAVDPGTTGFVADRFLRVHHARRSGAAFVQPFQAMRPKSRAFQTLVICFDPRREGHPAPTRQQVVELFEGPDGGKSTRGWWAENSGQRLTAGLVRYLGCEDTGWYAPPPGREGDWYWDNGAFDQMWKDALTAADPSFDFHVYDTDDDDFLSPDELLVAIVRPQSTPDGTTRGTSVPLDGVATPLGVHLSDLYLSAGPAFRRWNVGLISHEFSHSLIGAQDLYSPCPSETDARIYSVMSLHTLATHLDPLHKLKSGFVVPDAVDLSTWTTATLPLVGVEVGGRELFVLYEPARADKEYFVVERRFAGGSASPTYDDLLGDPVVLWHVIEDAETRWAYPFPASDEEKGCRIPIRFLGLLSLDGASQDLVWADGTPANVRVTRQLTMGPLSFVELAKLP